MCSFVRSPVLSPSYFNGRLMAMAALKVENAPPLTVKA